MIYIDVDDTLLDTTLTLDKLSKYPINFEHKDIVQRWVDYTEVMLSYDTTPLMIPLIDGAEKFLETFRGKFQIMSSARQSSFGRTNRQLSLGMENVILFFNSDEEKRNYLIHVIRETDVVIDDKASILSGLNCHTFLANPILNKDGGMSLPEIMKVIE